MYFSHKILFFTNSFSIGIMVPVLSLVLLVHGATIETLSLFICIYAITVVIFEVPSGIIADIIGKKKVFLLSHCFLFFHYLLIIFSSNFLLLTIACISLGLGRAFGSGSIDALEIDEYIDRNGTDSVTKINSLLSTLESTGLAVGALCGGFLGTIDSEYDILLLLALLLEIFLIFLSSCILKENSKISLTLHNLLSSIKLQLHSLFHTLKYSKVILTLLTMSAILGISLTIVETYWQPTLLLYLPDHLSWILGIISCLGYWGIAMGNKLGESLLAHLKISKLTLASKLYWILKMLLPIAIVTFGFIQKWYIFVFLFTLAYIILGAGNLLENTIFHSTIDSSIRASMLSISSLFLRGGGVISSIIASMLLKEMSLAYVWFLLPMLALLATILLYIYYN